MTRKISPHSLPPNDATAPELQAFIRDGFTENQKQTNTHFKDAQTSREDIGHGLRFDRRINVVSLIVLILMVIGFFATSVKWTTSVDGRLDTLTAAGNHRDVRLDGIDTKLDGISQSLQSIQDTADANARRLGTVDQTVRGRP